MWAQVEEFSDGQPIVVNTTSGFPVHCRFVGTTDAILYRDRPGAPHDQADYRFDRATVASVRVSQPERNWHPVLAGAMVITGAIFGLAASRNTDAPGAAAAGLIAASIVGPIGYPIAMIEQRSAGFGFAIPPRALRFNGTRPRMLPPNRLFH
jgi:hypothetical protein